MGFDHGKGNGQNQKDPLKKPYRSGNEDKDRKPGGFKGGGQGGDDDDNNINKVMRTAVIWLFVFGALLVTWFFIQSNQQVQTPVSYNEYVSLVEEGQVKSATIRKEGFNKVEFLGELKKPHTIMSPGGAPQEISRFSVELLSVDSETEEWWRSKGITLRVETEENEFWGMVFTFLPWIALIAIYIVVMRRMQNGNSRGIFSFGKSRARLMNDNGNRVTFEDVAGADEAKYELEEIIEFLRDPSKFQRLGGKIPRGVLLLGPPGTGKTLLARAVAGEANVPFFSISGADFVEMFVGVGASRVRDLFEQAKKNAPCIVFIDEIDAVGRHRGTGLGGGHDEREQTLNQLLVEMDGFEQNSGCIVIAATNRPDVLDPALLRPGRFDRQVVVDRPDVRGREGILKVHTRKIPMGPDVNLEVIAKGTPGLSGADLANLVNEAALLAARRNSETVTMQDIENAKDKILMGVERKSMVISVKEKEVTAYHEMGHALAGLLLEHSDPVHKVTIIPRGRALGLTSYLPSEESHNLSKENIEARIIALLAGRAAELIVFNQLTTGAVSDLERATGLARKMVCEWGMNDRLGPVFLADRENEPFLGRELAHTRHISEETARAIDEEIRAIVQTGMKEADKLLRDNIDLLHRSSRCLLERESLDAEDLRKIMANEELPPLKIVLPEGRIKRSGAAAKNDTGGNGTEQQGEDSSARESFSANLNASLANSANGVETVENTENTSGDSAPQDEPGTRKDDK